MVSYHSNTAITKTRNTGTHDCTQQFICVLGIWTQAFMLTIKYLLDYPSNLINSASKKPTKFYQTFKNELTYKSPTL